MIEIVQRDKAEGICATNAINRGILPTTVPWIVPDNNGIDMNIFVTPQSSRSDSREEQVLFWDDRPEISFNL